MQQQLAVITGANDNLGYAEAALEDVTGLADNERDTYILHLALPVVMHVFSGGMGFWSFYKDDTDIRSTVDSLFEHAFSILEKATSHPDVTLIFSNKHTGYYSESNFPFRDEFVGRRDDYIKDSIVQEHIRNYGYHTDGADEDEYLNDHSYEAWFEDVFTLDELEQDEAEKLLETLLTDNYTSQEEKVERLLREISSLGFGPYHYGFADDWVQKCIENKDTAKKYMDYFERMLGKRFVPDKDNGFSEYESRAYYRQAILLACCIDNTDNEAIEQLIHKYYSHTKSDLIEISEFFGASTHDTEGIFRTLNELGFHDIAKLFISEGITLLEAEIKNASENKERLCDLYGLMITLAACIDDMRILKRYTTARIGLLDAKLQNECETDEQRYEIISMLIAHTEIINDNHKTEYYKSKQQEILGLGFDMQ